MVLLVAVWRWDGGLDGEFAVIGDLRSIASLWVLEGGLGQLVLFLRWARCFDRFLSPASPPLTVCPLSFLLSHLSGSIPCNIHLRLVVSSLALLPILPVSLIPFHSIPLGQCLSLYWVCFHSLVVFSCPGIRSMTVVLRWGQCLSSRLWRRCLSSHLWGWYLSSRYKVGTCCAGFTSVPVVPVFGLCLSSRCLVSACRRCMWSVPFIGW